MKTKIVLLVSFIVFIMTACSNTPDDWEEALLTITFEQKGTPPADIMARLKYQINIKDSHGLTNVTKTIDAVESIQEKVAVGDYTIFVKAFDPYDNETYAEENTQKNIQAGRNYVTITINFNAKRVAMPKADPERGNYTTAQTITLSCDTAGATIYYTLDGNDPNSSSYKYTAPILIDTQGLTILKAIAVMAEWEDSPILTEFYTISNTPDDWEEALLTITFEQKGTLPADIMARLKYQIDIKDSHGLTNVTKTIDAVESIQEKLAIGDYTISVKAFDPYDNEIYAEEITQKNVQAGRNYFTITINFNVGRVATPVAYPASGEAPYGTAITLLNSTDGATIYYTLNGSEPTTSSPKYPDVPIILNYPPGTFITLKAIAVKDNMEQSETFTAVYGIISEGTVTMPATSPSAGGVTIGTEVALSAIPQDAEIWYTIDGSTPVPNVSTKYTDTNKITINADTTIRAIAVKTGMTNSDILTAAYTILSVDTPTANRPAGLIVTSMVTPKIILRTATVGADIWYTTDGSTPIPNSVGTNYSTPFPITANTTIKAVAVKDGMIGSGILEVAYTTILDIPMVSIPAGTFTMGQTGVVTPEHEVELTTGFYMGKYQVTQDEYFAVMGTNPSSFSSSPATGEDQGKRPVETVSWYDALVFCNKLSDAEGLIPVYSINGSTDPDDWGAVPTSSNATWNAVVIVSGSTGYRLPTEAQWEYACRAGKINEYYNPEWDGTTVANAPGWYYDNSGSKTHQVGLKAVNDWGLYDMHGNVYEWCWDWYGTYPSIAQTDPQGAVSGSDRVIRGGYWGYVASSMRSASRFNISPSNRGSYGGFRVVRP
ncbi:MAG: chitobiase/beta-hexosaminidase C-terminal domain-containing protein [Leptospirales bacterium]|nr:chitobiase/beta-hexosaminidase C-terminal domain-containing protein [Leptospirales bacterium]